MSVVFKTRTVSSLLFLSFLFSGCGTPFQGIRFRAQSPTIEEAFRKVSLAVTVDGYEADFLDASGYVVETGWRAMKAEEMSADDRALAVSRAECKISLQMQTRGMLFDVWCTPAVRYTMQDGTVTQRIAGPRHPLREKWEEVFRKLLERQQADGD